MPKRPVTETVKTLALALAIIAGVLLQHGRAHAQDAQTLVVAGGCFWCVEADFERVEGVIDAVSGFAGGGVENPNYRQVSRGGTGHLEAVQITYDPARISHESLLNLFLRSVDPTDAGGQFCDRGAHYATAIFVETEAERAAAEAALAEAEASLGQPIVTPIRDATPFYPAEAYHQDFAQGTRLIVTRRGPMTQAAAYRFYRDTCGRDARVAELWGDAAPFTH